MEGGEMGSEGRCEVERRMAEKRGRMRCEVCKRNVGGGVRIMEAQAWW